MSIYFTVSPTTVISKREALSRWAKQKVSKVHAGLKRRLTMPMWSLGSEKKVGTEF